jgi:hypothetical protein
MSRITSLFRTIKLRQILAVVLVGLTVWGSAAFGQFTASAQAAPMTPEAQEYQVNQDNQTDDNGILESLKGTAENVRDKLNLDQPLPESTKKFFKQVQGEDVDIHEQAPSWEGAKTVD